MKVSIERHLIGRLGGWRPLRLSIMRMLNVGLYTTPPKDRVTGNKAIMGNARVNFTMSSTPDTVVLQFTALVLTPRIQEAAHEALDEDELDDIEPVTCPPLSPRKPKSKPGPKRQATADLSRKFPLATHSTRERRAFTTAFKLGVLSYDI